LIETLFDDNAILDQAAGMGLNGIKLCRLSPLKAQSIHAEANADAIKVAGECPVISKSGYFAESFKERFLCHVFSFVSISQQVRCGSNQTIPMSRDEQA
jgi:hypothetical protein